MKLRALIADDEPLSRERVRQFLQDEPGIEIVAECRDGNEAVAAIRQKLPDLLFLDVMMPGLTGFDVIEALNGQKRPAIIFVTAHEKFAVKAFEAHGVDYLLKPFDRERLQIAVQRARERLQNESTINDYASLSEVLTTAVPSTDRLERVAVKSGGRIAVIEVSDIDWISAADNYVELHVGTSIHLLRITLTALESRLPSQKFMRANRSQLVNVDRIAEFRSKAHGDYLILLSNGTRLLGSRNFREGLKQFFGASGHRRARKA